MADKQLAYDARQKTELFDENDPLAELARIVGFEPRVAANTVSEPVRQEPAFDLEDELLREFESYDEPRAPDVVDHPAEPVAAYEPVTYEQTSQVEPEPTYYETQAVEPEPVVHAEPAAASAWNAAGAFASADWTAQQSEPVSNGARDLIEELEMSIGAAAAVQPVAPAQKAPQWSAASIKLPLANFHTARREAPAAPVAMVPEPVAAAPVAAAPQVVETIPSEAAIHELAALDVADEFLPVSGGFPAEIDRHEVAELPQHEPVAEAAAVEAYAEPVSHDAGFDLAAAAKDGVVASDAALTEALPQDAATAFDIDNLLADVSRYPVPQRAAEPVHHEVPVEAAPVRHAEPVQAFAPVAAKPAAPEEEDPFAGHDFELDLEGIELELADLDFAEPVKPLPEPVAAAPAPVAAPAAAFVPVPVAAARPIAPAPVLDEAPRPVAQPAYTPAPVSYVPAASVFTPAPQRTAPVQAAAPEPVEELPFDPSMIADADGHPEAVEEMHVPALPPVEQHKPVAQTSDFDFDVDAEIASLFEPMKSAERAPAAAPAWAPPAATPAAVKPAAAPAVAGLDDLERALEEDLRRSMREPVQRTEQLAEVHIQSAGAAEDMHRARSMKRMLAAAAMVVVFAGGAYGLYTVVADSGIAGGSGEPRIISADKEPVKVVPDNPGGKTVPNQDKAVYDRVAGATETPKQTALVSSDEEPVDVVQRTLTPEIAPEDNDGDVTDQAMSTPVSDTQDPRLLPDQNQPEQAANDGDADRVPAVSPRKVRTMIVKPDGTLVAREDEAPVDAPVVKQVKTTTITPNGSAASFPASTEVASADIRSTPVENTATPPAQAGASESVLAKVAASNPANVEPPVRQVQSTQVEPQAAAKPADAAPVPAVRPAAKPAAAAAPQPPKPAEVASVAPAATQPQASAPSGGYGVQIASLPSEAEANKSYASLSKKFGSVLAGRSFEIRKADIAGKGTFYRVRIPAGSKDEAAALCEKYRAAGGTCLISK